MLLYTVIDAFYDTLNLDIEKSDKIIFNFGVNDCIYRKNKYAHIKIFTSYIDLLKEYPEIRCFYERSLEQFKIKKDNDLIQFLTFKDFEYIVDKTFSRFPGQGIVLSVNYFSKNNKKIGWSINEIIQTNQILKSISAKYNMIYIDLWKPEVEKLTYDGVHLTIQGHQYVADKIRQVIL